MAKKRKLPYKEGTVFAIPLETSGYGIGVVARMAGDGRTFGYFFGPRRESIPNLDAVKGLNARDALWASRFGDLGLLDKEWPVIGEIESWSRESWPLPPFVEDGEYSGKARKIVYSENLQLISHQPCDPALAKSFPSDESWGAGAVECELTQMLDSPEKEGRIKPLGELVAIWREAWKALSRGKELPSIMSQPMYRNALLVHLKLSDNEFGTKEEFHRIEDLCDDLKVAIDAHNAGVFDGNEFGQGEATLYMYGPDADVLFSVVEPVLKGSPLTMGAWAIKRYGEIGDLDANEVRVDF
jgi:hypothetical protein